MAVSDELRRELYRVHPDKRIGGGLVACPPLDHLHKHRVAPLSDADGVAVIDAVPLDLDTLYLLVVVYRYVAGGATRYSCK